MLTTPSSRPDRWVLSREAGSAVAVEPPDTRAALAKVGRYLPLAPSLLVVKLVELPKSRFQLVNPRLKKVLEVRFVPAWLCQICQRLISSAGAEAPSDDVDGLVSGNSHYP